MSHEKVLRVAVVLLTSLAATESGETREGIAYACLMGICSLDEFTAAIVALERAQRITRGPSYLISITANGRAAAAIVEAKLKAIAEGR